MNFARFTNPPGHLERRKYNGTDYWAYVPAQLPPSIIPDMELMSAQSKADLALGELAGLGRNMVNPQLLIRPFVRREAVLSSRIEGTQADVTDVYAYEAGQLVLQDIKQPPSESDVREVINYVRALDHGIERLQTLPVSIRLIQELHSILLSGVRGEDRRPGEFRTEQNWIGGRTPQDAEYVPPPAIEMGVAVGQFENYLHSDDPNPPLVRLALIHYQFEAIHPFFDGNGRIGRLLISLLLVSWGLLPLPLLYLSAYFEQHRDEYIDKLLAISERGDWRGWLLFFLDGVASQARDAGSRAKTLQDLQISWRDMLQQTRVSSSILKLTDSLFESPIVTIPQAAERLAVTYPSAQKSIVKLVECGILRQAGSGSYGKAFLCPRILDIISES